MKRGFVISILLLFTTINSSILCAIKILCPPVLSSSSPSSGSTSLPGEASDDVYERYCKEKLDAAYERYCTAKLIAINEKLLIPDISKIVLAYSPLISYEQFKKNSDDLLYIAAMCVNHARELCVHFKDIDMKRAVELLESGEADVNYQNKFGRTPLKYSIETGNIELVILLLNSANINIDLADQKKFDTPLMLAVKHAVTVNANINNKEFEIVRLLLERGANFHSVNSNGQTALQMAGKSKEITDLLKRHGATK